jgi:hypothetical protein
MNREELINQGYFSIIKDECFNNGFKVSKFRAKSVKPKTYLFKNNLENTASPDWQISQWMSEHLLDSDKQNFVKVYTDDVSVYEVYDDSGELIKSLSFNHDNGNFSLLQNASKEYLNITTNILDPEYWWIHLLLEQDYSKNLVYLRDLNDLFLSFDFKITKCDLIKEGISNCAQFNLFLSIQNRNKRSKEYGRYMWFGFNLFDNRYVHQPIMSVTTKEYGSNVFLRIPSTEEILDIKTVPNVNEKVHASFNLFEDIKATFIEAKQAGYFKCTKWEDLAIGTFNIGFEVPGYLDIGVDVENLLLMGKKI